MCQLCMSSALNGWQTFEEVSAPVVPSTNSSIAQLFADAGLLDLADAFPAAEKSFASIFAKLQDQQAAGDKWAKIVEKLFDSTGTDIDFGHEVLSDTLGGRIGEALDKLREYLEDSTSGEEAANEPDLEEDTERNYSMGFWDAVACRRAVTEEFSSITMIETE